MDHSIPHRFAWWHVAGIIAVGVCVLVVVSGGMFLRYVRSCDDLLPVEEREKRLKIIETATGAHSPPASVMNAVQHLVYQMEKLPRFTDEVYPLLWSRNYNLQLNDLENWWDAAALSRSRSWNEDTCSGLEAQVDALGHLHGAEFEPAIYDNNRIQRFLEIRLFGASRALVQDRATRLARYLQTLGPRQSDRSGEEGLHVLALRMGELGGVPKDLLAALQDMESQCLPDSRWIMAAAFLHAQRHSQTANLQNLRSLVQVDNFENNEIIAAWEIRRWRGMLLQNYLDGLESLASFTTCVQAASMQPTGMLSNLSLKDLAVNWSPGSYQSRRTIRRMLLLRILEARLQRAPLPSDPFSVQGNPLQIMSDHGRKVTYSIGPGGDPHAAPYRWQWGILLEPAP
jgi:hypothetical protein